jgi:hypothetical protein
VGLAYQHYASVAVTGAGNRRSLEDFKATLRKVGVRFPAAALESSSSNDCDRAQDATETAAMTAVEASVGNVLLREDERLAYICGVAGSDGASGWRFAGSAETLTTSTATTSSCEARHTIGVPGEVPKAVVAVAVAAAVAAAVAGEGTSEITPGPQCQPAGLLLDASFLQRIQSFL